MSSVASVVLDKTALFRDLQYTPHPGQLVIHQSTALRRVVACGVRWGKSKVASMEAVAAALEPRDHQCVGWVVGPTYDIADRVYREIVMTMAEHLKHRIVSLREHEKRLVVRNLGGGLSEIRAKSADNPVSLLGEGLDWLVVDEASRLKPMIWESYLSQRLIDKRGWALLISTPKGKGWFYDLYRRGQGADTDYQSWNWPSVTNPRLDPKVIEAERARIPDRTFRQEYEAEFCEGSGSVFRGVREAARGAWQDPIAGETYWAGLDLARVEDYTVLVIVNSKREVVFADRFTRIDWSVQVSRIAAACERYGGPRVFVDSTGPGEPIVASLRSAGIRARPFVLSAQSKTDLINNLALLLEKGEVVLPRPELWSAGIEELESYEFSTSDAGNVRMSSPSGVHDDCVVALALALWPLRRRSEPIFLL